MHSFLIEMLLHEMITIQTARRTPLRNQKIFSARQPKRQSRPSFGGRFVRALLVLIGRGSTLSVPEESEIRMWYFGCHEPIEQWDCC